jgi:hypothetical protein
MRRLATGGRIHNDAALAPQTDFRHRAPRSIPELTVTQSKPPASDIRQFPRHRFEDKVVVRNLAGEDCRTKDLSAGGVGVTSTRALGTGRHVDVAFLDCNVLVRGVIRHEREIEAQWHIGIQFLQPQHELMDVTVELAQR